MLKTDALQSVESGFYSAINEDGVKIYVARQKGCGWTVYTPTHHGRYEARQRPAESGRLSVGG